MAAERLAPDEARIVEEELVMLLKVQRLVTGQDDGEAGTADYDREMVSLRDQLAESRAEDHAALVEHLLRLSALRQVSGRGRSVPVNPASPYFAHLRLREGDEVQDILIGRRSFIDRQRNVHIVDWRNSPISRIYYRYEEGDEYEESFPGGVRRGVVELRRTVTIEDGRLTRVRSGECVMVRDGESWRRLAPTFVRLEGGQGAALRAPSERLGRTGPDTRLPEITALIDPDQFHAITTDKSGVVVINGGAGTGKTTIALHRAAWLHFQDAKRFAAKKMLVLTPGDALARYVGRVLPALDVNGVAIETFEKWAHRHVKRLIPALKKRPLTSDTPMGARRLKRHPALLPMLEEAVRDAARAFDAPIEEAGGPALLKAWVQRRNLPPAQRVDQLARWVRGKELERSHRVRQVIELARSVLGDPIEIWSTLLTDRERLARGLLKGGAGPRVWELDQLVETAARQADDPPDYSGIDEERRTAVDGRDLDEGDLRGRLDVDDLAILLRICQLQYGGGALRGPAGQPTRYEHVVVDEAQDLAPLHIKIVVDSAVPGAPITLAGDTNQRVRFDSGFDDWGTLIGALGVEAHVLPPLSVSYRSTQQVMELARHVLGPLAGDQTTRDARDGAPVELLRFHEVGEAVAFMADSLKSLRARERRATVALIARTPEIADSYYDGLIRAEVPGMRRIREQEFDFSPGIDVTDVYQVKGLEYDYVVLLETTADCYPEELESRHLLHVGATRAAHQLWLVSSATPSPLLPPSLLET